MIKAVSFDYGGVLNHGGTANAIRQRLCHALQIEETRYAALSDPINQLYRGKVTPEQFWTECCHRLGIDLPVGYMERWYELDFNEREPKFYVLAERLRAQGTPTAVLSNITAMSVPAIRAVNGYEGFEPVLLSCESGFAKPDPEFYALLLDRLGGLSANEVVHLDDQDYCLEGARKAGLQAIKVITPDQAINELKVLLTMTTS